MGEMRRVPRVIYHVPIWPDASDFLRRSRRSRAGRPYAHRRGQCGSTAKRKFRGASTRPKPAGLRQQEPGAGCRRSLGSILPRRISSAESDECRHDRPGRPSPSPNQGLWTGGICVRTIAGGRGLFCPVILVGLRAARPRQTNLPGTRGSRTKRSTQLERWRGVSASGKSRIAA
jgi:hypothetical protein